MLQGTVSLPPKLPRSVTEYDAAEAICGLIIENDRLTAIAKHNPALNFLLFI
jgi:hypothetical protein